MSSLQFVSAFDLLPSEEKPREKLEKYGAPALNLWELAALVLRTGRRSKIAAEDVMQLSKRLLAEGGFRGLFTQTDVTQVRETFAVHKHHAEMIVAVSEICRRLHGRYDIFDAGDPDKVFGRFRFLQEARQEQCFVLHLDHERKCVYQEMVAIGGNDRVQVFPNDILRTPLWLGTREIIIVHNHPGRCVASKDDIAWTMALAKGSWELHRITVFDHVIIGKDGYFSFLEQGLL